MIIYIYNNNNNNNNSGDKLVIILISSKGTVKYRIEDHISLKDKGAVPAYKLI